MIRTKLFNQIFWTNSWRLFAAGCSFSGDLRHAFGSGVSGAPCEAPPAGFSKIGAGGADSETMKIFLHSRPEGFELGLLNAAEDGPKTSPKVSSASLS
jgi:hypothetical protein